MLTWPEAMLISILGTKNGLSRRRCCNQKRKKKRFTNIFFYSLKGYYVDIESNSTKIGKIQS